MGVMKEDGLYVRYLAIVAPDIIPLTRTRRDHFQNATGRRVILTTASRFMWMALAILATPRRCKQLKLLKELDTNEPFRLDQTMSLAVGILPPGHFEG